MDCPVYTLTYVDLIQVRCNCAQVTHVQVVTSMLREKQAVDRQCWGGAIFWPW